MYWTKAHDIVYCREILVSKLFETKKSSYERGKVWDDIADNLNSIKEPSFDVDKRSVRDRLNTLTKKYKKKMRQEENSSGISPERTELDALLEEICERESICIESQQNASAEKDKQKEVEKKSVEEVRKLALETFAKSKKRKPAENENDKQTQKRRSGNEALEYLTVKAEQDRLIKEQEIVEKRQERDMQRQSREQQDQMMKAMIEQQQSQQEMQNMIMRQQQQQTQLLMGIIDKMMSK